MLGIFSESKTIRSALIDLIKVVNALNPQQSRAISPGEAELLIEFLLLPDEKYKYQRFSTPAKRAVLSILKEKNLVEQNANLSSMNAKLYSLQKKKILKKDIDGVVYVTKSLKTLFSTFIKEYKEKGKMDYIIRFQAN